MSFFYQEREWVETVGFSRHVEGKGEVTSIPRIDSK